MENFYDDNDDMRFYVERAIEWTPLVDLTEYMHLSLIHISEPTRLLSISYAVFCLKKKTTNKR